MRTTDGKGVDDRKSGDLLPSLKETTTETAAPFGAKTSSSLLRRHRRLTVLSSLSVGATEKPAGRQEMTNDSSVDFAAVGRVNAQPRPRALEGFGGVGEEPRGAAATADDETGFRPRHNEELPTALASVERVRRRREAAQSSDGVIEESGGVVKRGMSWLAAAMISVCAEDPCKCYALARDRLSKTVLMGGVAAGDVGGGSMLQPGGGVLSGGGRTDYYYYDYDDGVGVDGTNCPPYEPLTELTTADSKRKSSSPASPNRRRPKPGMRQWRYDGAHGVADRRLLQLTRKP
jgi:hypothetical protein